MRTNRTECRDLSRDRNSRGRNLSISRTTPTDLEPDIVQGKLSLANVVTVHSPSSTETTTDATTTQRTYEENLAILRRENQELKRAPIVQKKKKQEKEASTEKERANLIRKTEKGTESADSKYANTLTRFIVALTIIQFHPEGSGTGKSNGDNAERPSCP
ncbi:hypothetical protein MRX96_045541 [Rhipicephalus microplus]